MEERLVEINQRTQTIFGLENYWLARESFYLQKTTRGIPYYEYTMEWFPSSCKEIDEDANPDGAAVIGYNLTSDQYNNATFVMQQTESTAAPFQEGTLSCVKAWIDTITGFRFNEEYVWFEKEEHGCRIVSRIDGITCTPSLHIEVKWNDAGQLLSFVMMGEPIHHDDVEHSSFTLTLEEIEPFVREHLTLVHIPVDADKTFVPVYAIDEVFITVKDLRLLPYFFEEQHAVMIHQPLVWTTPLTEKLDKRPFVFSKEVEKAVALRETLKKDRLLTSEEIEESKNIVQRVMQIEYSEDSGVWELVKLYVNDPYIEAICELVKPEPMLFKRKIVIIIERETMSFMNCMDNENFSSIFADFEKAPAPRISKEEAFEKMVPYITLEPRYVLDVDTNSYLLCGLVDSDQAVHAVTGEVVSLKEL